MTTANDHESMVAAILSGKVCPYCRHPSELVDSAVIYGQSYGFIYLCRSCDAYCGCHKGTTISLGRLANKELRFWKKKAHHWFDQIWNKGIYKRKEAYSLLSKELGLDESRTHIGMFDVIECRKVIEFSKSFLK